jgi:fructose-1,6-bisphosphatase/inositol monophosphatase family enzyme
MHPFETILAHLREQALEAGDIMRHFFRNPSCKVYLKPDGSKVTDADLTVSKMLLKRAAAFPDILLYSEETNPKPRIKPGKNYFVIDELDGTAYFADGVTGFAHLAAYYDAEEGFANGVLYYPLEDVLLYAVKGQGAFLERGGERIRLETPPARDWHELRFFHPLRYLGDKYKVLFDKMGITESRVFYPAGILRAIEFAEGKLDAAVLLYPYISPWDLAAEKAFLQELGFVYCYLNGQDVPLTDNRNNNNAGYLICPKAQQGLLITEVGKYVAL